ncbi:MAG TPA: FAD binding domain-containing protein [Candidatus Limnocylindrales bacterium]|nr:FAD binding domain-containing protein [Candidatus Limnocylindrales bacterium]
MYILARSLKEATEFLFAASERVIILAGGTDLMVFNRDLIAEAEQRKNPILDVSRVAEMRNIRLENHQLVIGSVVTYRDVLLSRPVQRYGLALVEASQRTGSAQIRNVGTLGGNVVNASPAGDALTALIALNGEVEIAYGQEYYRQNIETFLKGPKKTGLPENHLVTRLLVPVYQGYVGSSFYKLVNRASSQHGLAISVVSATAVVQLSKDKSRIERTRLVLGAVAPTPVRARPSEEILQERPISRDLIKEAALAAVQVIAPIDDIRATATYRREVVPAIVENVLIHAIRKAAYSS